MTDKQLDTRLMSKLSTVHQKSKGGLCKTPLALQRGRYTVSECSFPGYRTQHEHMMLTNDWRLCAQLRDKVINQSKKRVTDPQAIGTAKSTKYKELQVHTAELQLGLKVLD